MMVIRRVYLYLLAFAGLLMLAGGVANLGRVLIELLTDPQQAVRADYVREQVSSWGAAALLGLPVWLLHWWWAQRLVARQPGERMSTLRRLYMYAVLGVGVLAGTIAAYEVIDRAELGRWTQALSSLPRLVVAAVVWLFHWRIADADRVAVGEEGGSATLRRWYVYTAAVVGLWMLLYGASALIEMLWLAVVSGHGVVLARGTGIPATLVGLGLTASHGLLLARRFQNDRRSTARSEAERQQDEQSSALGAVAERIQGDRSSTLRTVAVFISLAVAVTGTVVGLSQALYYGLARALGVDRPGGVGGSILEAAAGPVSLVAVYGIAWAYMRLVLRTQTQIDEAPRQAGVRRLYTYLVALVSVTALAVGLAGLLWVLGDALSGPPLTRADDWWRNRVALFSTLLVVGLPLWLLHWKPTERIDAAEAGSLARRLYVYLVLIASSLTLLFSAAVAAYRLLTIALGAPVSASLLSDLTHDIADGLVAGLLVGYHVLALRADARLAGAAPKADAGEADRSVEVWRVQAASQDALASARSSLEKKGLEVELVSETLERARISRPGG